MLSNEEKLRIKQKIDEKITILTCPMCSNRNFIMVDGYFNNTMQANLESVNLGGQGIPTIGIVCNNCGFVSQHAIGVLGLLENKNNNKDEPKK